MKKIYVVEDDQAIREVLEMVLSSEHYSVQTYSTVSDFNERDMSIDPDLYIFDVMLPDGSGITLCENIKNNTSKNHLPVIIMSAHADLHRITMTCQPDDFIPKPFDIGQFLQKVHDVIERSAIVF